MKKKVIFGFFFIFLIISIYFVAANDETEQSKIDRAYACLEEKVEGKCSSLSLEERIFSLLAIKKCANEIINETKDGSCFPKSGCEIKTTAQAILSLNKEGIDTNKQETWLLSQNATPSDIIWYLQIESSKPTTCTISYSNSQHQITIGTDKKIQSNAGNCLSLSEGGWWLKISPNCYDKQFEVSCDKNFLTTLLFKKASSETINVLEKTNSASAGGTTTEKINSFCFAQKGSCNYEGSLWATLVLNYLNYEVSSYIPYLISMKDENEEYLPEVFLYYLTGYSEFSSELLSKQKSSKWWMESENKFYDTTLALYAFQYDESQEKTNSKEWLLEVQNTDGCWNNGHIRDTAFILYSIWPRNGFIDDSDDNGPGDTANCESEGYWCMSRMNCQEANGDVLDFSCAGVFICCDSEKVEQTCEEMNGEICTSNQECSDGTTVDASDLEYGKQCCVGGICEEPSSTSECMQYFGTCKTSCNNGEEKKSYNCEEGKVCCVEKTSKSEKNYLWVWVLAIMIVLVVLGIIFKDRLRQYWFKTKSRFGKSKPGFGRRPGFPSQPPSMARRIMPRRILTPSQRPTPRRYTPVRKKSGELDEVLKKLKEIGE